MVEISVILPVFNSEEYLSQSIESILNQSYDNFELIIINDGSTDESERIINRYSREDSRIKVKHRFNKGLVYSLNEGISISKGKYIARMDADDISHKERLDIQLRYLKDYKIDILGTKVEVIGDLDSNIVNDIQNRYGKSIGANTAELKLLKENIICHPSVFMKRSFIEEVQGYRIDYPYAEDYDLWIRALKKGYLIENYQQTLIQYRVHAKSKVRKENQDYSVVKNMINIRLDYLMPFMDKYKEYIIWGAGKGGELAYNILSTRFRHATFIGFIDKFKNGEYLGYPVISPEELNKIDYAYVFIATTPGKEYAENFLLANNYKFIKDFIWLV